MLTFIVNPAAGNGYALKIEEQLKQEMSRRKIECCFVHTNAPGHATQLAKEAVDSGTCSGVISVGGDGTAFEVACGLMNTGMPLGIVPAGTGNDFIKTVGLPKKPLEALEVILTKQPRPVDVGGLNDRLFLNVCGTGFDVTVLGYTQAAKQYCRGLMPYLIGLIRGIAHYKPTHVRFTADGHTEEREVLICSIANGRFFGGGIAICPDASADDGLLDLVVVEHKPRWQLPFYVLPLLMGRVLKFPFTSHKRCKSIEIFSPGMNLNIDGEIYPMDEAKFTVLPGALSLFW